jgi:PadR family transcriptional regulator AphA
MSLKHILLGMLESPASGYDLKKEFEYRLNNYWNAELAQIYPTLSKLEREGLISSSILPSSKGPNRKVYKRLKAGKKELVLWLKQGPIIPKSRIDYAAQMTFLQALPYKERLNFIQQLSRDTNKQLSMLQQFEQLYPLPGSEQKSEQFSTIKEKEAYILQVLVIHHGLLRLQALVDWCDMVEKHLLQLRKTS